ncbi:MAG: Uma2 family endonuclease [Pyrinomonadaceae bacterium]
MATVFSPPEQRVVLTGVSWNTYERLLIDLENQSAPRLTFDRGLLEIMSPSGEHERYNRTISLLVEVLAEELDIDVDNLGSTTFRREDIERGFEPDSCFYIRHAEAVRGKARIDLANDPAPDLVIEIDITSGSLDKFPIYAQVGVPEIWRFDGSDLTIFRLVSGSYERLDVSSAFPLMTSGVLTGFIRESETLRRTAWLRKLRAWIDEHRKR